MMMMMIVMRMRMIIMMMMIVMMMMKCHILSVDDLYKRLLYASSVQVLGNQSSSLPT
jgi:hypothetical protein